MSKHTPGPWYAYGFTIRAEDGLPVAQAASAYCADTIDGDEWREFCEESQRDESEANSNAEHIVRCVNAHDDLLEALEETLAAMRALRRLAFTGSRIDTDRYPEKRAADAADAKARAVIAKAEGRTQ